MRLLVVVMAGVLAIPLSLIDDPPAVATPATDEGDDTRTHAPTLIGGTPTARGEPSVEPSPQTAAPEKPAATDAASVVDVLERGPCAVRVKLRDAATGTAVASQVQLWRLDAPANEHFVRGDQLQATAQATWNESHLFTGLPAGRYRVHVGEQRRGTEDPPAFVVDDQARTVVFDIPMPRTWRAVLEVYDASGRLLTDATGASSGQEDWCRQYMPPWRTIRRRRGTPVGAKEECLHFEECCEETEEIGEWIWERCFEGFMLDPLPEHTRATTFEYSYTVRLAGRSDVELFATCEAERDHVYRAVSVPVAPVHDAVLLPDGSRAIDHDKADFKIRCFAKLANPFQVFDARDHVVCVKVALEGFVPLKFHVTPGGPIEARTLQRKP